MKSETVKIMTFNGRVTTLTISKTYAKTICGKDKFGNSVIIPTAEIKSMLPIKRDAL